MGRGSLTFWMKRLIHVCYFFGILLDWQPLSIRKGRIGWALTGKRNGIVPAGLRLALTGDGLGLEEQDNTRHLLMDIEYEN